MRLVISIIALLGIFVLVAMFVAPHEPTLRGWYLNNACPLLDTRHFKYLTEGRTSRQAIG